jgi:hypothetical protein
MAMTTKELHEMQIGEKSWPMTWVAKIVMILGRQDASATRMHLQVRMPTSTKEPPKIQRISWLSYRF